MKKGVWFLFFVFCFVLVLYSFAAAADKITNLDEMVVKGKKLVLPTKQTNETVYTGSEITKQGMEAMGARGAVSVYEAVNVLPGVSVESVDPYGLGAEQKNIRVRGVRGMLGAMTVAGVPNWGGNPMGPREYLFDMENFDSIAVYKGSVPADLGTGVGARGGAMEMRPRWPEDKFGVNFSQSAGGDNYRRTFLRVDSGDLPVTDTRLSVSGSLTDADKWKGPGDLGPRKNVNIMLSQPVSGGDDIQLWFNYNDLNQDLYKPLTYEETRSLGSNYKNDYNRFLTGIRAEDINYYKYNRGEYLNKDFLAVIPVTVSDNFSLKFKPYYSDEKTQILGGIPAKGGTIQKRSRDIERYGIIAQAQTGFSFANVSLGYWYEANDMSIQSRMYEPSTMSFAGYGMYTVNEDDGIVHSPYLKIAGNTASIDWQAGLKYFYYKDPASQGYTSAAPDYDLIKAPDLFRKEKTYDEFLPSFGLNYRFSGMAEFYTSYGRNQIRPYAYMPLINLYNNQRADFQAAGVSLNDMFDGYEMEISDNFEIGARLRGERMEIRPSVFYSRHKNLLTTVYDPRIGPAGVNYYQNVGDATGYGLEVETNFFVNENITMFFNPTYTSLTYDDDLSFAGAVLDAKGNQVVDTPEWMLKTGVMLSWRDFEVVPMLRYLGRRYGDVEHNEKIDDYVTMDLKIGYKKLNPGFAGSFKVSLELINIFDKEYVSFINAMDDSRSGAASYHVGAPFTALLAFSLEI
jgi:iron complex outermembrane receptor protein